jgi:hypothetical protein
MNKWKIFLVGGLLTSCNAMSVQYVDATGRRGTGTANISAVQTDGTFSVTDKGVTCSGKFPSWQQMTVVFPVQCTDGQSGSVTMTRPASGPIAGEGTMQLGSGEVRRFIFGKRTA